MKGLVGDPLELDAGRYDLGDVCESAAIYRIQRSFERNKKNEKADEKKPMDKSLWLAKSAGWVEPEDNDFLNQCYMTLMERQKKGKEDSKPKQLQYKGVTWTFDREYSKTQDEEEKSKADANEEDADGNDDQLEGGEPEVNYEVRIAR